MVLKNPTPTVQTNNKNPLVFKQIQTGDYELHKIQQNISEVVANVTQQLNNKVYSLASQAQTQNYALTITPVVLIFQTGTVDTTQSYSTQTGNYKAPQEGVYECNISAIFTIDTGTPAYLIVTLFSNIQSVLCVAYIPVVSAAASANLTFVVQLQNNENVSFMIASDTGTASVTMSQNSRTAFLLVA